MAGYTAAAARTASGLARYRQLSPSASVFVSPLSLGTMNFGTKFAAGLGECSKETSFAILDHYFSSGGNFIDTASGYHDGETETWLGEWMAARKNREQLVLATKYTGSIGLTDPGVTVRANHGGNGAKTLRLSLELSLKQLQTAYVDILYVHYWYYTATIPEVMHALNDLVAAGKVLYLGISDAPAWVVAKANQYARDHGLRPFVVYQGPWNLAVRDLEREIIPMCRAEGMGVCAYSPLNAGRFQTEAAYRERKDAGVGRAGFRIRDVDRAASKALQEMGEAKGASLANVALAYLLAKEPYTFPIVGGRKLAHLEDNVEALKVRLGQRDVEHLEAVCPFEFGFPHSFLDGSLAAGDESTKSATHPRDVFLTKYQGTFDWVADPKPIVPPQ